MRNTERTIVLALALVTAACGWRRAAVPVSSDTGSTALLVGSWSGEYNSKEAGRQGTISFDLASEKDTAYCDVVMIPKMAANTITAEKGPAIESARLSATGQPLRIQFVRLGKGHVVGSLEPYRDPDCGCQVRTTFDGVFTGPNTIEGTFTTRGMGFFHQTSSGKWKVTRRTSAAAIP